MSNITKAQWEEIEEEMSHFYVNIVFTYKGHEITVQRVRESESKTCLQVYIDGAIKGSWVNEDNEDRPGVIRDVWKLTKKRYYSPAKKAKILKDFGKRRAKKFFPDLDNVFEFYIPNFSKASVLCRQFKKLDGLELVEGDA